MSTTNICRAAHAETNDTVSTHVEVSKKASSSLLLLQISKYYDNFDYLFHPPKQVLGHHRQSLYKWRHRRGTHHHGLLQNLTQVTSQHQCFHLCKGLLCRQLLYCHWHAFSGFETEFLKEIKKQLTGCNKSKLTSTMIYLSFELWIVEWLHSYRS